MGSRAVIPPLPPGFVLESDLPPLPPGFQLEGADFPAPPGTPPPPHSIPEGLEEPPTLPRKPALRFPGVTTISALPDKSVKPLLIPVPPPFKRPAREFLERNLPDKVQRAIKKAEEVVFGGPEGETLASDILSGRVFRKGFSGQAPAEVNPIFRPEALVEKPGFTKGVLRGAGEMTRPDTLLMLATLGGAAGAAGKLGLPFLQRLIVAGFSADMIKMYKRVPEFKEAADRGDTDRVWELTGELVVPGAMAAGAALHATRGTRLRAPLEQKPIPRTTARPSGEIAPKPEKPPLPEGFVLEEPRGVAPEPPLKPPAVQPAPIRQEISKVIPQGERPSPAGSQEGLGFEQGGTGKTPGSSGVAGLEGPRPTLPSLKKLQSPELVRKGEILKQLSEKLQGVPFRVGRFRDRALGIYKVGPESIRLKKALDIPVAMHEAGTTLTKSSGAAQNLLG